MSASEFPSPELAQRVAELTGRRPTEWRRASGGYTTAERWVAGFDGGLSCFVKSGSGHLADFLRAEFDLIYSRIAAPFLASLVAWDDDGFAPVLILEDLSHAEWPPPWSPSMVRSVLEALESLQAFADKLDELPSWETHTRLALRRSWHTIERDAAPFLGLGLCSMRWLTQALPTLENACESAPLDGDGVLHFDVRSDNLCFRSGRAILVDWNHACRGNRAWDIAAWLPSLHSEGGPLPEAVQPLSAHWPAVMSGYFAARAGLPPIPQAPAVRTVQLSQLRSALPWAVRALGLPPLDGPAAPGQR